MKEAEATSATTNSSVRSRQEEEKEHRHDGDVDDGAGGVVHQPWLYPTFLKDTGKLRVKERYWRFTQRRRKLTPSSLIENTSGNNNDNHDNERLTNSTKIVIIPDALTWRKYLRLVTKLVQLQQQQQQQQQQDSGPPSSCSRYYRWILLESAAELLDYRNQSPVVVVAATDTQQQQPPRREAAATQERTKLIRLVQEQQQQQQQQQHAVLSVFCDLSVRQSDDGDGGGDADEWGWLNYDQLSITERSRHALIRAGRMTMDYEEEGGLPAGSAAAAPVTRVILIVSDGEHKEELDQNIQLDEGMIALSMEDFLQQQMFNTNATEGSSQQQELDSLSELLEACNDEYEKKNVLHQEDDGYEAKELSPEQIQRGLREKTLFRGRLDVTKYNPKEAFVSVSKGAASEHSNNEHSAYFIDNKTSSSSSRNGHRAFHQDVVIIRPLPKSEWGRPVGKQRLIHHQNNNDDDDENDDNNRLVTIDIPSVPTARIVAISDPSRRSFVATMIDEPKAGDSHVLVVPMDVRIPKIRIHSKSCQNYVNKRLIVHVDGWEMNSTYPHGRCIDVIGTIGDLETEVKALLLENQIDLMPFSNAALACLPIEGAKWTIPQDEINTRRDLRMSTDNPNQRHIFSVDPPGCQDIDDTMHAYELPNGDIEIGVHIADVTYFVKHNSSLDIEAQKRGTTFYLVDRRFDMLPSLLSSDLCSLHGETDRLAVSVIWTLSSDLETIKSCWYGRTVIYNCAAMTYEQADNILEGRSPDAPGAIPPPPLTAGSPVHPNLIPTLKQALTTLTRLARKLRGDREAIGGAVDLSSGESGTELKFTLVDGKPTKVTPKKDQEIHHTIAELMILANTYVATKIFKTYPDSALLRIHRSVEDDRFSDLREMLEAGGISLKGASNFELSNTLKNAQQRMRNNPTLNALFKSLATRAMSEAQYICTGGDDNNGSKRVDFSHYGLGLEHYTHFTSPIRRYADIVVHKQLLMSLQESKGQEQEVISIPATMSSSEIQFSVPGSKVVSILAGEGIEGGDNDDEFDDIDALIEGASELALSPAGLPSVENNSTSLLPKTAIPKWDKKPYITAEVSQICDGLNLHTRLAKHSSMECQQLFLSLYFRNNVETTGAVVVSLRTNGFWAYVPRFDLRVPIYLVDMQGQLQVDPALLGLSPNAGLEPTAGFAVENSQCRRFPNGKCELIKPQSPSDDERLEISVADAVFVVRPLSVVTVHLTCDNWDVRARVPSPRAQLGSSGACSNKNPKPLDITSEKLMKGHNKDARGSNPRPPQSPVSIFEVLSSVRIQPVIEESVPPLVHASKQAPSGRALTLGGRFGYSGFVNPDTRSAVQEVAQQQAAAASAERRSIVQEKAARMNEYETTKGIERSAMARQQRLHAEKRNARRSKAK